MGRDMMRLRRGILLNTPHEEQASGAVASFATDIGKLKECVVGIEPVQDLHGYDSPWPPGGGKNLVDTSALINATGLSRYNKYGWKNVLKNNTTYTYSVYGNNQTYGFRLMAGHTMTAVPQPNIGISSAYVKAGNKEIFTTPANIEDWEYLFLGGSGNGAADEDYLFQIELGSVSSPTYSPCSNICPISGWSEAKVTGTGKNFAILSQQILDNDRTQNGITWKATSKSSFHVSGTATGSSFLTVGYGVTSPYLRFLKAGTYTVSCNFPANCSVYIYGFAIGSGATSTTTLVSGVRANSPRTFTITDDWMINIQAQIGSGVTIDDEINVQVEPGTTASVYEAYRGVTVTIDLDGTRYGGTLNVLTGVMTVTMVGINLGSLNYSYDNRPVLVHPRFVGALQYAGKRETYWSKGICSCYPVTVNIGQVSRDNVCGVVDKYVYIVDTDYTDATALHNALTDQYIVYNIASPFTVQLTPAQLRAIKGQNNIFSDCGDVAVKYWKH